MRKRSMMTMGALLAAYALTTSVSYGALQNQTSYTAEETVAGGTDTFIKDGVGVTGGHLTITGAENLDLTMDNTSDESLGINVINGKLTADDLTITVKPGDTAVNNRPKGMIVRGSSTADIKNLNVTVTKSNRNPNTGNSPDSDAAYGVAVGYNWKGEGDKTDFTVNNATIKVNNTADSVKGHYTNGLSIERRIFFMNVKAQGDFLNGYQMSGIKIYRSNGAVPKFHATGDVNVTVDDVSADKVADYNVGLYISGDDASAVFDGNTNIKVTATGINSAGIKIGKPKDSGTEGNATVTVNGKLDLDTTGVDGTYLFKTDAEEKLHRGSGAVRLFEKGSKLLVTGQNTKEASTIKASTNGVVFDTIDYENLANVNVTILGDNKEMLTRGADNENGVVNLTNTKVSTTSEVDDLILANARHKAEGEVYALAKSAEGFGVRGVRGRIEGFFQTGAFNVKNAKFNLTGELSEATAAKKGWAIRAKSENAEATVETDRATSELTATIADKAVLTGLIHADKESTLHMTVDKEAAWKLAKKEDLTGAQESTATTVTLSNGGILDAGTNLTDDAKAEYTVTTVQKDGTTASDFKNEGGIITTVNKSYADVLTLNGNYTGKDGRIKMNTKWDSPGDEEGANSVSDLVHITGTATGSTTVVPVAADGTEAVIDGSIGSIAADLTKNTVPVVRADVESSEEGAFTGVAKTTGAGELKLAHRVKDGKHEWFWTLTGLNKTPNLDKRTPGYVQMPDVDSRMIGQILRTLHERRSENPRVLHEQRHMESYPMSRVMYAHHEEGDDHPFWAKVLKDYGRHNEERFGYTLQTHGVQLGRDWNVKTKEDGSTSVNSGYVAYQYGHANFRDNFNTDDQGKAATDLRTGLGKVRNFSVGLTRTKYNKHEEYMDVVGQFSWLRNAYEAVGHDNEKQSGWGFAGSIEFGHPYINRENERRRIIVEPQGQLVYTYINLHGIQGTDKVVSYGGRSNAVGRLGLRISRDNYNAEGIATRTIYGVANVWRSFRKGQEVHIGEDIFRGNYASTIGELGLGAQWRKNDRVYFYADLRFERNLGGSYYKGYRGNVSVKYIW
ncbi:autotransporter outer membrane beta-barrel domain-containing protein [Veillonella sp. CHU732]|uniref:autotransporter outer membrane beta-barrel domain-containing protein n=1 Tax=Veillonella sp. CHU732 TaxID=2490949 RepID=UPI00197CBE54|nr:autotransporter outer membrane beta-barrel domain-containing protein [Veillonella sp. CHU732]